MADMYYQPDVVKLMKKKHIVFFGDSNARAIYKDFVWLLNQNTLIDQNALKRKQEDSFCGDKLGRHSDLSRGREYEEERFYEKDGIKAEFYFITRCYNARIVDIMEDINLGTKDAPDVIFLNSTLWDVSRWGPNGIVEFKNNMLKLARLLKASLPSTTLVIWATALPVSSKVQSSLLVKQIDFLQHTLRFDVMEANTYARQVMVNAGFDVLDNHFYMRMQIHRRVQDGVHYFPTAIRFLTNLLLTHIALSWDVPLPGRASTILLDKAKALCGGKAVQQEEETKTPATPTNLIPKGDEKKEKGGKKEKEYNNCHNKMMKPQNPGRQTAYKRRFQNFHPPEEQFYQQRRMKGGNWRNHDWRRGEPQPHWPETSTPMYNPWMNAQMEQYPRWSETPSRGHEPWSHRNNAQWGASTSSAETNWSEDHWPVGQGFGDNLPPLFPQQPRPSILARSADMLAQAQVQLRQAQEQLRQIQRYHPY